MGSYAVLTARPEPDETEGNDAGTGVESRWPDGGCGLECEG